MKSATYTPGELLGLLNDVEAKHAPEYLFVSGDTSILNEGARVSIVGSRQASPEGVRRAGKLARRLTEDGHVVVSGLAIGIDTAAHRGAIENGGKTIGVIGTPLSKCYPHQNARLQNEIATNHLLVSQFAEGSSTGPWCFPARNRTMAMLSDATVIVEAGDTSGSLSQGWEALRLGRWLFIMKSVVDNPNLSWPQKMLEYGAEVLSDENLDGFLSSLPHRSNVPADGVFAF